MINWIKKWWENLPEEGSGKFQLDKRILRALFKEAKSTLVIVTLTLLADIVYAGYTALSTGESFTLQVKALLLGFALVILKDINLFIRKLIKDYTK